MKNLPRQEKFLVKVLTSGFELGAAISMEIEGETVLDLWGG